MKIENEFTVSVSVDRAWEVLTDLEGIAPCLPGATLTGRDGSDYLGRVKVKLGPVTSEFTGKARFLEKDAEAHRAVIEAQGREVRGGGNASAAITAHLREDAGNTIVSVDADLRIVGKLAQFGSGMIQQVSTSLLGEFTDCLERTLSASSPAGPASPADPLSAATGAEPRPATPASSVPASSVPASSVPASSVPASAAAPASVGRASAQPPEGDAALNVGRHAGRALAKRLVPIALGVVALVVIFVVVR